MRLLILFIISLTVLSCSDEINTEITPGEFQGKLSGAIEKELTAEAFYLTVSDTSNQKEELSLNFITDRIANRGPETIPIYTGIFLQVPWDKKTGVLSYESDGFSASSIVYPYKILQYQSGQITIDSFDEGLIEGSISINAIDNNSTEIDKEVKITGRFIALSGSNSTN